MIELSEFDLVLLEQAGSVLVAISFAIGRLAHEVSGMI